MLSSFETAKQTLVIYHFDQPPGGFKGAQAEFLSDRNEIGTKVLRKDPSFI